MRALSEAMLTGQSAMRIVLDETTEMKPLDALMQSRIVAKARHLASAYGTGRNAFGAFAQEAARHSRFAHRDAMTRAHTSHAGFIMSLPVEERRWAEAFHAIYNVGINFYAQAKPEVKRKLEKQFMEMAEKDTKAGRKAAEVVIHRTMAALEGEKVVKVDPDWKDAMFDFKGPQSGTMRSAKSAVQNIRKDQLDAYRYLFQQLPKAKP